MKIDDKDVLSSSLQNIARTGAVGTSKRPVSSSTGSAPSSDDAVNLYYGRILAAGATAGEEARPHASKSCDRSTAAASTTWTHRT